ncbi:MAG: hypothetical protein A3J83_07450 [Elusimicrobia bacterium RIFOXYA2_FULL_40_6]|nr:MAG: hypothetical protein A3J83_07450 [Elusimicrobia bacterium RIFOXYA2_FULL_40_6]
MSKQKDKQRQKQQQVKPKQVIRQEQSSGISKMGKRVIFSGIFSLLVGFFILTKTDPQGQNWASILSPFLIVGSYIAIAAGIIIPEPSKPPVNPPSSSPH